MVQLKIHLKHGLFCPVGEGATLVGRDETDVPLFVKDKRRVDKIREVERTTSLIHKEFLIPILFFLGL